MKVTENYTFQNKSVISQYFSQLWMLDTLSNITYKRKNSLVIIYSVIYINEL